MKVTVILAAPEESFTSFCDRHGLSLLLRERSASLRDTHGHGKLPRWMATFEPSVEIKDGGVLRRTCGNGDTTDEAIADLSDRILSCRLVVDAYRETRREFETPEEWCP